MKHLLNFLNHVQGKIRIYSLKPFPVTVSQENAFDSDFGRSMPFHHSVDQLYKSVNSKKALFQSLSAIEPKINLKKRRLLQLGGVTHAVAVWFVWFWLASIVKENIDAPAQALTETKVI